MSDSAEAQAAMQKEWDALKEQKVWNLMIVREKSDVVSEARINKKARLSIVRQGQLQTSPHETEKGEARNRATSTVADKPT